MVELCIIAGLLYGTTTSPPATPSPSDPAPTEPSPTETEPEVDLADDPVYRSALDEVFAAARRAEELSSAGEAVLAAAALGRAVDAAPESIAPADRFRFTVLRQSLAEAEVAAYDVDADPQRLERAQALLVDVIAVGWADAPAELEPQIAPRRDRASALLQRVEEELAELESKAPPAPPPEPARAVETTPEPDAPLEAEPSSSLIVAGGSALAIGVLVSPMAIVGFVTADRNGRRFGEDGHPSEDYPEFADRHRLGNGLGIAGAVTSGLLVATGAVLLGVGLQRRGAKSVSVVPARRGVMLVGRF
ncbi:MAG: hypothetical protein AAF721_08175 [Myxococcota bacterium]